MTREGRRILETLAGERVERRGPAKPSLLVAEQSFRRLDAPELLAEVAEGVASVNGKRAKRANEKVAA